MSSRCAGRCLMKLPQDQLNFTEAQEACGSLGAHLAVPRSTAENQCALSMAVGVDTWLGVSDRAVEGVYAAEDGGDPILLSSPFWGTGEPSDATGEFDCVQIWSNAWDDTLCSFNISSICQIRNCLTPECV
ncbi:pulmonary surfactant-associated protein D-like [Amphibalanus amphitrite]|uniref:pulmonary surfactant-associated protein D-like n=1 Tax=Amphibalanus amphitrite TaxID=1232801 RepID=UPI001C9299CA|nr:pulmonary surfactant-associated protein D-like [Amphibalanus amphitrite]